MKTYFNISEFPPSKGTVVTIGTFDGVHLGHQKILKNVTEAGAIMGLNSVVLTFHPHPRAVLQDASSIQVINSIEEKIEILETLNIDSLIVHPFNKEFSRLTAEEFVIELLVKKLNVKKIVIGYDHRFGRNRTATIEDLILYGNEFNFEVEQISAEEVNEITVSSTKIREALHKGDIQKANQYLGHPYQISGIVVKGQQLGRALGFPTANIQVDFSEKLIPAHGVYIAQAVWNGKKINGVMNIGNRPTIAGQQESIEIHLLDFDTPIYGEKMTLYLLERIRNEQKFDHIEALKAQIAKDKATAMTYFQDLKL